MYQFLSKNGQLVAFGTGLLVVLIFLGIVIGGLEGFTALADENKAQTSIFDFGLYGAIVLTIVAAVAALAFGILQVASDPKGSMKGLIGFGVLLALLFVFYSMASAETSGPVAKAAREFNVGEGTLKFIGGAITTTLVLSGLSILVLVFSEARNFFK